MNLMHRDVPNMTSSDLGLVVCNAIFRATADERSNRLLSKEQQYDPRS